MANYYTHLAFDIPASPAQAERFAHEIELATLLGVCGGEDDDAMEGVACRFDFASGILAIFDREGAPNLEALAKTIQRLFPNRLPFGFAYSCTCSKPRSDSFGGGLFAVGSDAIVQRDISDLLAEELTRLGETADAA